MSNKRRPARQWGGTFLGIVLGLIVGLAIAVVVALYITKAPTPFVEKTPPQPSNLPATQSPNPNQALQNQAGLPNGSQNIQVPLMPSAPQAVAIPNQASAAAPSQPSPADILNGTTGTQSAAQPQAGTQAAASQPAATPAPATAAGNSKVGYYLQVGAYKSSSDAEQQRAQLALQGLEAKVTSRNANGLTLYRVRLGPYSKLDEMNQVRQRLASAGVETAVIRFTKQ